MKFSVSSSLFTVLLASLLGGALHAADFPPYDGTKERDAFWEFYNKKVLAGLQNQEKELPAQIAKETDAVAKADLEAQLTATRERLQHPEYFTFAKPEDIPTDLKWENGMDEPEIGDANAKKGGTMRQYILSFPPTLRILGENGNSSFRGYQYDDVEMALINLHPETGHVIPCIAKEWAVSPDNRTVYFRLDPEATFSDGTPITADDFFTQFYMQLSEYPKNPFGNQWYAENYANITRYDEHTLSISLTEPKPLAPYYVSTTPLSSRFYSEFGPDFEQRYQWRCRPTAGAYVIHEEDIHFGRSVTLSRVKDWWAKDKKFYRNRYNVDHIVYRVVRLQEKVLELFRQGELDVEQLMMGIPEYWYEKLEIPEVFNGYIHKAKFYNIWPGSEAGLWLNLAMPPLNNKEIRLGLCYATNYQKVIDFDLRGDFQRLNTFSQGFPLIGDPPIKARPFDVQIAREHFAKAGYTKQGNDGVLINDKGERLSLTILHRKSEIVQKVMQRLKEEAIKCGLEYKLEGMDSTAYFQKVTQKKHQLASVAFSVTPPIPDHYQGWHSKDAFMEDGKTPRPNTNNLCSFADPRMDKFCEDERHATTIEAIRVASWGADQIIHDEAPWIPAYEQNYYRVAYWRWVQWPAKTFNVAISELPMSSHVHWIDEDVKRETEAAMRSGKTFPETDLVFDQNLKSGGTK
ncbi:MAG: extracellular solute-binding protein [Prosthecobacter sp.]|uniref:extracellular solute-binding protein n=1 Tax=Prosthecobacter sp. TaxID=1965333 RepID=UPI0025F54EF1|nr:extracellular solute-binding protein [Prosthecobacter sp.]MCF7785247.1 extracellular solute-binding protein [Prosthecobacter sp.]